MRRFTNFWHVPQTSSQQVLLAFFLVYKYTFFLAKLVLVVQKYNHLLEERGGLAFRGRVPIDVIAKGGRYTGEKEGGGKYVPTLDPVTMAAEAGKGVRQAN